MSSSPSACNNQDGGFQTTQWSLVISAGDGKHVDSKQALEILCQRYWMPLYVFARRTGYQRSDAQDLTQAYFERLLEKDFLADANRDRGRFRTFLLTSFRYFLANERDRQATRKRGGDAVILSLDFDGGESLHDGALSIDSTPDEMFDRQWAETVLGRVMGRLQREQERAGKGREFSELRPFISGRSAELSLKTVAENLGATDAAMRMAVSRLRSRYREILNLEISETVATSEDVAAEIADLFRALAG